MLSRLSLMDRLRSLAQLSSCLRGEIPVAPDWPAIVMLANRALVTPQLYGPLAQAGATQRLPQDVREFLCEVFKRNRERNRRLSVQLSDALRALNAAGIEPLLLKGAAVWASSGRGLDFDRILADLDLLVNPSEAERALDVLGKAGFPCAARHPEKHSVAELGRPADVGFIDLHQRPPGPRGIAEIENLESFCTRISWFGARAMVPSPAVQILFMVLHDQFHDGDYWRGGFVLRHLVDIAELSKAPASVDWRLLDALCKTSLVRNALGTQLVAAERLLGAAIPQHATRRIWVRFQHQRHIWQYMHPKLSTLFSLVGLVTEWPNLLTHRALNERTRRKTPAPETKTVGATRGRLSRVSGRIRRFRRLLSPRAGKL